MPIARTDSLDDEFDNLCEHPFLVRIMELGIVGGAFSERAEVECFPDALFVLSVDARTSLVQRRLRSIQRVIKLLSRNTPVSTIPFNLHALLEVSADAAYLRVSSLGDLMLIICREVLEIALDDKQTTFLEISKMIKRKELLPYLGRICNPKRAFRLVRNSRIHSGFERGFDGLYPGFEMSSMFRDRGQPMAVMSLDGKNEVSLDQLYNERRESLLNEIVDEVDELLPLISAVFDILRDVFDCSFSSKIELPNSYMKAQRSTGV
ncbi:MAG: hypothetical protein ACRC14_14710 [Paracoccaceae bacterium]